MTGSAHARGDWKADIRAQLDAAPAAQLMTVVAEFADRASHVLGSDLVGVYLTGSFALGAADVHSDVDFVVVSRAELTAHQESSVRDLHRAFPDRAEEWARHLEGSWTSAAALRDSVGAHPPWLYVDNGSRVMERSRHDDTLNARWVFRAGAIAVVGPEPHTLVGPVDPRALRLEAVEQAETRSLWLDQHPDAFSDGWAQPYSVLTFCRLIYTAESGQVGAKAASAAWVREAVAPREFAGLLSDAIIHRTDPYDPIGGHADPERAVQSPAFVRWALREVRRRAARATVGEGSA